MTPTTIEICVDRGVTMLEQAEIEEAVRKIVPHATVVSCIGLRVLVCPECGKGVAEP